MIPREILTQIHIERALKENNLRLLRPYRKDLTTRDLLEIVRRRDIPSEVPLELEHLIDYTLASGKRLAYLTTYYNTSVFEVDIDAALATLNETLIERWLVKATRIEMNEERAKQIVKLPIKLVNAFLDIVSRGITFVGVEAQRADRRDIILSFSNRAEEVVLAYTPWYREHYHLIALTISREAHYAIYRNYDGELADLSRFNLDNVRTNVCEYKYLRKVWRLIDVGYCNNLLTMSILAIQNSDYNNLHGIDAITLTEALIDVGGNRAYVAARAMYSKRLINVRDLVRVLYSTCPLLKNMPRDSNMIDPVMLFNQRGEKTLTANDVGQILCEYHYLIPGLPEIGEIITAIRNVARTRTYNTRFLQGMRKLLVTDDNYVITQVLLDEIVASFNAPTLGIVGIDYNASVMDEYQCPYFTLVELPGGVRRAYIN